MIGTKKNLAALTVAIVLSACADSGSNVAEAPAQLPTTHQQISRAIVQGFAAASDGDTGAQDRAGSRLKALNAKPLTGTSDLAAQWTAAEPTTAPMRGRVRGPGYRVNELESGQTDTFGEIFYGVEEATISVSGTGRYRVTVLDEDTRPPLCDADTVCRFTPDVTARYQVIIRNEGAPGRYVFVAD